MEKIIAIEGIDGSGKTIQYNMLIDELSSKGFKVSSLEFPAYDSVFGKAIGNLLSGKLNVDANSLDPMSMALWFAADRVAQFNKYYTENKQKNNEFDYLVINRYVLSNAVYQSIRCNSSSGISDDELIDWIFTMEHKELGLPYPDLYIFLDVSQDCATHNVDKKGFREYMDGNGKDVYESKEDIQHLSRLAYLKCASKFENINVINCMENGKLLSPQDIHCMIMQLLRQNNIIK